MRVVLEIERLVLEGLPLTPAEAERIRVAAEVELRRLFAVGEVPARLRSSWATPGLAAPALKLASPGTPDAVGTGIARAVHDALMGAK